MKLAPQALAWITVSLSAAYTPAASTVGSPAPALEPTEWMNTKATSWKDLKGRLVLVEKWATWWGPCKTQIPHLNELTEKFEKRGLTIIGVSDESPGLVKKYIETNGIKYTIAIKGANEYKTSGIPHAWLVSPKGEIVWEGHPGSLKESQIEENLTGVRLTPTFSFPRELRGAERDLNAGKYSAGLKTLEDHLKKPKSPETGAAAKAAIEQVKEYGASQLKEAEDLAKDGDYGEAAAIEVRGHEGPRNRREEARGGGEKAVGPVPEAARSPPELEFRCLLTIHTFPEGASPEGLFR
jgi:cytochrome c biogenesis protein CcmG, thiol:disulfide interchange protein DsbE